MLSRDAGNDAIRQVVEKAGAGALGNEGALGGRLVRFIRRRQELQREDGCGTCHAVALDATGRLKAQSLGQLQLLEDEAGEALGVGWTKQDAVGARSLQIAVGPLDARGASQHTQRRMHRLVLDLDARLVLRLQECRADRELRQRVDLVVLVVGIAEPEADGLDAVVVEAPLASARPLRLFERDMVLALGRLDAGDVVGAVERGVGHAEEAVPEDVGAAQRIAVAVEACVGLPAGRLGDTIVAGAACEGVGMHYEIAGACFDDGGAVAAVIHGAVAAAGLDQDAVDGDGGRDAVVDGVDHAADGLRAVAQASPAPGPPPPVPPPGDRWAPRDRRSSRNVARRQPVLLDAHPKTAQAANDRPAGAGSKRRRRDAGPWRQHVAQR